MRWLSRHGHALAGGALMLASLAATVVIAWRGVNAPPTASEAATFVLLAGGFQLAAAWVLGRRGRADPTHARSSFLHLFRLAARASEAGKIADRAGRRSVNPTDMRDAVTKLSVHLAWIEEGLVDAGEHWAQVHPELRDVSDDDLGGAGKEPE